MAYENGLTHFDKSGQAIMVDVSEKKETSRTAIASGRIRMNRAVYATVKVTGQTGVEMEALHSVSVALLTIYDMCKALDKDMEIEFIHLDKKTGGKSGIYLRSESAEKERATQQTE